MEHTIGSRAIQRIPRVLFEGPPAADGPEARRIRRQTFFLSLLAGR